MLNEIEEVKAYLGEPDADDVRLGAKLLSENFDPDFKLNGIADVLTLIACHYLYDFSGDKRVDWEEMAILIMRIWCGFENDVEEEKVKQAKAENEEWFNKYPHAEGWLRTYHQKFLKKVGDWSAYSLKWKERLNSTLLYKAESLCYENILAQAVARGPLKSYDLLIKNEYEEIIKKDIKNGKDKKLDARRQRNMLKLLAAYKVLQLLHPGQEYVLLQTNRILNWMGFESDNEDRWCLEMKWHEETIFRKESCRDYKKLGVNKKFLEKMDVHLQESSVTSIPEGYIVYQDAGHGKKNALIKL